MAHTRWFARPPFQRRPLQGRLFAGTYRPLLYYVCAGDDVVRLFAHKYRLVFEGGEPLPPTDADDDPATTSHGLFATPDAIARMYLSPAAKRRRHRRTKRRVRLSQTINTDGSIATRIRIPVSRIAGYKRKVEPEDASGIDDDEREPAKRPRAAEADHAMVVEVDLGAAPVAPVELRRVPMQHPPPWTDDEVWLGGVLLLCVCVCA